jgi:hypothetical protein
MSKYRFDRREWLRKASFAGAGLRLGLSSPLNISFLDSKGAQNLKREATLGLPAKWFSSDPSLYQFSKEEESLLEEMQRASFLFFWEQANAKTGQVEDRGAADGGPLKNASSVAATGFGLTALCIAAKREWQNPTAVRDRVRATLSFTLKNVQQERGFLYHFVDGDTGKRIWKCEVSPIDTCLFLCGAMTCRGFFDDKEIQQTATELYERVDWNWMLNGGQALAMGWHPEDGFIKARWDVYSELMMMYLLGMASPKHALAASAWDSWKRPQYEFQGVGYIGSPAPLFVHQYTHAWFNFRGKHDKYGDYFANSIVATKIHKLWCRELASKFPDYTENLWGITASDSEHGYTAWGGPPQMGNIDGSIVPCAAGGSLPFLPKECFDVLQNIREKFGKRAWKRYGFVDAFNPLSNWNNPDVLGIDAGITVLMAENARTGFVWEQFAKNPEVAKGFELAGFQPNAKT